MSESRRNSQSLVKNNIQTIKVSESNSNKRGRLLNRKRNRRAKIKRTEKEQSNDAYTETNETTVNRRTHQEIMNENESSESIRLNRFMRNNKEKYIKLNEATEEKNENKLKMKKREKSSSDKEDSDDAIDNENKGKLQQKNNKRKKYYNNKNRKNKTNMKRRNNSLSQIIGRILKKRLDKMTKKTNQQNKKMKEQNNKKIKELNNKITEQSKKINEQNKKINEQNKKIKELNKAKDGLNKENVELNMKLDGHNVKINEQNEKINLLLKIQYQSDIYSKKVNEYIMNIGCKFTCLFNSCKVLYIWKICDFILEGLINNYESSVALTTTTFINNRNVSFKLIVFTKDIKKISKYVLNLIVDFLMETKQNCSSIVHMNKSDNISKPLMKELFYILLNKAQQNNNNEFNLEIQEMANVLLDNNVVANDDNIEEELNSESNEGNEEEMDESEIIEKNNNQSDDEMIKKIMSEENNNDIKINDLWKILKEKIRNNDKGIKDIAIKVNQIINPSYFYNLWKNSFKTERYKKLKKYKSFIKESHIKTAKEMNNILVKLLPNYEVNFFDEDPSRFSKKIKNEIASY